MNFPKNPRLHLVALLLFGLFQVGETAAQAIKPKTVYASLAVGLSRAEDGLPLLRIATVSQTAPTVRAGVGYRLNRFVAVDVAATTMLSRLRVEGTRLTDNSAVEIEPLYSSLVLQVEGCYPLGERWEALVGLGGGLLMQTARITTAATQTSATVSNFGFMLSPGIRRRLTDRLAGQIRFDVSNEYGDLTMWKGDVGVLLFGLTQSF